AMRSRFLVLGSFLLLAGVCAWFGAKAEGQSIDKAKDYAKAQAIFQQYCFECHGSPAKKLSGTFDVTKLDPLKARITPESAGQPGEGDLPSTLLRVPRRSGSQERREDLGPQFAGGQRQEKGQAGQTKGIQGIRNAVRQGWQRHAASG